MVLPSPPNNLCSPPTDVNSPMIDLPPPPPNWLRLPAIALPLLPPFLRRLPRNLRSLSPCSCKQETVDKGSIGLPKDDIKLLNDDIELLGEYTFVIYRYRMKHVEIEIYTSHGTNRQLEQPGQYKKLNLCLYRPGFYVQDSSYCRRTVHILFRIILVHMPTRLMCQYMHVQNRQHSGLAARSFRIS